MEHHFNIEIAQKFGVNEAIFLNNIAHWILHNKANDRHFHENRYWTYNTARAFLNLFPYWSAQNLRTVINNCLRKKLIIKGNFNKRKNDRTLWYALSDEGLRLFPAIGKVDLNLVQDEDHLLEPTNEAECGFHGIENEETPVVSHLLESTNPFVRTNTALPYINTDNKQKIKDKRYCSSSDELKGFNDFWSIYPRKQKKSNCIKIWLKEKLEPLAQEILTHVKNRLSTEWHGKDLQFIPLPDTFLRNERWHDEIVMAANVKTVYPERKSTSANNEIKSTVKFWEPGNPDYDRMHQAGGPRRIM